MKTHNKRSGERRNDSPSRDNLIYALESKYPDLADIFEKFFDEEHDVCSRATFDRPNSVIESPDDIVTVKTGQNMGGEVYTTEMRRWEAEELGYTN